MSSNLSPCSKVGPIKTCLFRTMSRWVLNTSKDDGFIASLCSLFQCLTTLMTIFFSLDLIEIFCFLGCSVASCHLTMVCALCSIHPCTRYFADNNKISLLPSLLKTHFSSPRKALVPQQFHGSPLVLLQNVDDILVQTQDKTVTVWSHSQWLL